MQRKSRTYPRDQQQRIDRLTISRFFVAFVQLTHRLIHQMRRKGLKPNQLRSVGMALHDRVRSVLPRAAAGRGVLEEIAMQLQHDVRRQTYPFLIRVDGGQDVAVAGDLLFRTIARCRLFGHQITDSLCRRDNPFDAVGRLGALDHRCLAKRFQRLRHLLSIQFLLPAILADEPDRPNQRVRVRKPRIEAIVERRHLRSPLSRKSRRRESPPAATPLLRLSPGHDY
jgi:hypothetical protein